MRESPARWMQDIKRLCFGWGRSIFVLFTSLGVLTGIACGPPQSGATHTARLHGLRGAKGAWWSKRDLAARLVACLMERTMKAAGSMTLILISGLMMANGSWAQDTIAHAQCVAPEPADVAELCKAQPRSTLYAWARRQPEPAALLSSAEAVLSDPSKEQCWSNSARVLGVLGGPAHYEVLLEFVKKEGSVERSHSGATMAVGSISASIVALGEIAKRTHLDRAALIETLSSMADGVRHWRGDSAAANLTPEEQEYFAFLNCAAFSALGRLGNLPPHVLTWMRQYSVDRNRHVDAARCASDSLKIVDHNATRGAP